MSIPTPLIYSPLGGASNSPQIVPITSPSGSPTYYTTDGSAPIVSVPMSGVGSTGKVTDPRDGKVYKTVLMPDGKWWMAEELRWTGSAGILATSGRVHYRSATYSGSPAWAAFAGAHLPSRSEFSALVATCGGANAGRNLRTATGWSDIGGTLVSGMDLYGFSAGPTGYVGNPGEVWHWYDFAVYGMGNAPVDGAYAFLLRSDASSSGEITGISHHVAVRLIVDSGNVPDMVIVPNGRLYVGPLYLTETTTIRAASFSGGQVSSTTTTTITITGADISRIPSYPDAIMPLLLEQYKADR